ncbi:hypothetical protein ABZZ74_47575 [Streptomyces sp. NPDC006476]|uniref:hypothetical protein n=1 Tax=Streptomyces sp. NPDC006476 TaxID=3157175 RepID=UPI0033B89994
MSNDQQPEPDEEPGKAWTPGEIRRATRGPRRLEPSPAGQHLAEQMRALIVEFEHSRRGEVIAAGGDPDEDRDPLEFVRDLAEGYEQHRDDEAALARYLDQVARQLTPEDVRALRVAAEAVKKVTPLIIRIAADEDSMTPAQIAEDLGMTESYVYRMLREHRANFDPQ